METGNSKSSSSHNSDSSSLLKIGLEFGQKIYFEDVGIGVPPKSGGGSSSPSSAAGGPPKKGRSGGGGGGGVQNGGGQQQPPPRCQVEGCNLDLSEAKAYYSRHKVCGTHSKTGTVIVAGLEQRFCQQCSRFHLLPEFDKGKRSCRRRLAGHNERRRKPPPGSLFSPRYGSLSSSILETNSRSGGFLMDFSTYPKPNGRDPWPNGSASERVTNNIPTGIPKFPPHPWQSNLDNPPPDLLQGSANRSPYPNHNVTLGGCFAGVTDSSCALSLLSNQPSDSTNQPLSLGPNYYVNPDGGHMIQPAAGADGGAMDHFSSGSWGFKSNEASSSSPGMHPHLGLGPISQLSSSHYSGELELAQQSGRQYMELELSRAYDTSAQDIHWSL